LPKSGWCAAWWQWMGVWGDNPDLTKIFGLKQALL
jgi:hypothetical protein